MKMLYRIGILCAAFMFLVACSSDKVSGNGKITTKTREVTAKFSQINVEGTFRVGVIVGGQPTIRITTDSNIVPLVVTKVDDGVLTIANKPGVTFNTSKAVFIQIMVPTLNKITASGANRITALRIASNNFKLETNGAVQANLTGTANKVSMLISGSGSVNANRLVAKNVSVHLNGSGRILVNATQKLDTKITGSGKIIYAGNPSDVDQSVTGSGTIERMK